MNTTGTAPHHHVGRDAALAGGTVGAIQHERNVHPGPMTTGGEQRAENTAAGTGHGTGLGGKIKNALDPNVDSNGNPKTGYAATGVTGAGAGAGAGTGYPNGTTGASGTHHHAGRDAMLAGGAVGVGEHIHNKHHSANAADAANASTGAGYNDGYGNTAGAGVGAGTGTGTGAGTTTGTANIAPSTRHAGLTHAKGKLQEGLGNLTGDRTLQAKGLANQEQANAERFQTGQIGEAQHLERAAAARRGDAVMSGAHPAHGTLGGTNY
ncbi:hypothetical protein DACRYDRAFT_108347 [Dacryopinax primogenitus]|uniref:CsbD-like domain-containing protein n=1 Tax=Dacryopinax primogenitus (strain DJM 731) TaxID=1858805 RepID=M5FX57_DACPD|nr:uncharacterized protein DACRYDRAFT_108347 [Dacryopinax primogenitus]EJU01014.1 hypothetical protein DACRYDRAFT_108347 [Dacryopinax primogenitus]